MLIFKQKTLNSTIKNISNKFESFAKMNQNKKSNVKLTHNFVLEFNLSYSSQRFELL